MGQLLFLVFLFAPSLLGEGLNDPEALRRQIREVLFVPSPLPDLAVEKYGEFSAAQDVVAERVSYKTAYGLRVPAIVYRSAKQSAKQAPAFIVVNGHGGDKYSWYSFYSGILYARAGAVVLTYDPIGEGERNTDHKSGTRAHDPTVDPPEMGRRMGGLMMTDVMQAVSYLASRADVDSVRIAAGGYSMGSFVLGLTCAVETRLRACVLVGGGNLDGPGGYWETSTKRMCQGLPYAALSILGDRPAVLYALHALRGRTLIHNGTEDEVVSITKMGPPFFANLRRRTIAILGVEGNVFEIQFTLGTSHRPYFLTRPVAQWLEDVLDFPAWTKEQIAAMPDTHIGQWASSLGVAMDRSYATEHREGGTKALGEDVPALTREQLNALPDVLWRARKNEFIYESWVQAAAKLAAR